MDGGRRWRRRGIIEEWENRNEKEYVVGMRWVIKNIQMHTCENADT